MKWLALLFFLHTCYFGFSQCIPQTIQGYGSVDFTTIQYTVEATSPISYLKDSNGDGLPGPTADPNMSDPKYPATAGNEKCNKNASLTCLLSASTITYLVYYPKTRISSGAVATSCVFPAIILFHGGGFSDCNGGGDAGSALGLIAQGFAARGYVAFVVEYRTGRYLDPTFTYLSAQQLLAEYRAFQDARGAIRSIIYHQQNQTSLFQNDLYHIDLSRIFLGGNSAGSIIALHTAYYNANQIAAVFPAVGTVTIANALGPIDADYYYGAPTIEYQSRVKGVLDMWGQMALPKSYAVNGNYKDFWINNNNTILPPIIGFHGQADGTLPIDINPITFSPVNPKLPNGKTLNSETTCLLSSPFKLDVNTTGPNGIDLYGAGSKGIYDIFHSFSPQKRIELLIDCNMGHGLDKPKQDPPEPDYVFTSNFGTSATTAEQTTEYIIQRAAIFFQAILTGKEGLLHNDIFYDLENFRKFSYPNSQVSTDNPDVDPNTCGNCNTPCPPVTLKYPDEE